MMLDRSGSMRGNFRLVEAAGEAFVRALLPEDKARVGSFAETDPDRSRRVHQRQGRTGDGSSGRSCRSRARRRSGTRSTPRSPTLKDQEARKVVLVFTDGADNPGNFRLNNLSFMDIARRAQQSPT
jgi:hypothetical protein